MIRALTGKGDLWLHYKCPECEGIEKINLQHARRPNPYIACPCGHSYDIEPIKQVNIHVVYGSETETPVGSRYLNREDIKRAKAALVSSGYSEADAKRWIQRALTHDDPKTVEGLVLRAIAQATISTTSNSET